MMIWPFINCTSLYEFAVVHKDNYNSLREIVSLKWLIEYVGDNLHKVERFGYFAFMILRSLRKDPLIFWHKNVIHCTGQLHKYLVHQQSKSWYSKKLLKLCHVWKAKARKVKLWQNLPFYSTSGIWKKKFLNGIIGR